MELLDEVKNYLMITYKDEETDENMNGIIERGQAILNDYAGAELNYDEEGLAKQLLFDYCRYARSHAAEMFEVNFKRDLISLREMTEVKLYADKNTD